MSNVSNNVVINFSARTEAISKGVDKTNKELAKIKKQQAAFNKDMKGGLSALQNGLGALGQSLGGLTKSFGGMGAAGTGAFASIAGAAGPVGIAVAAITAGVAVFTAGLLAAANAADELGDAAERTDISAESFQSLGALAKQTALEMADVEQMLTKINVTSTEALNGNEKLLQSYKDLGITWDDLNTMGYDDLLLRISKITADGNVTAKERNALMDTLGSKIGPRVISFLKALSENDSIESLTEEFKRLGLVADEQWIKKLSEVQLTLDQINLILRTALLETFGRIVDELKQAGIDAEVMKGIIRDIADIIVALSPIIGEIVSWMADTVKEFALYVKIVRSAFDGIKGGMASLTSGTPYSRFMAMIDGMLALKDKSLADNITDLARAMANAGFGTITPGDPEEPESPKPSTGAPVGSSNPPKTDKSEYGAAIDKFMMETKKSDIRLAELRRLLDMGRKSNEMTKEQEAAIVKEISDIEQKKIDEFNKTQDGYNNVIKQVGTLQQRIEIAEGEAIQNLRRIEAESGRKFTDNEVAELLQDVSNNEIKRWEAEQDAIEGSFNAIIEQYGTTAEKVSLERERLEKLIQRLEREGHVFSQDMKDKIMGTADLIDPDSEASKAADRKSKLESFMKSTDKGMTPKEQYEAELQAIEDLKAAAKETGRETDVFFKKIDVYQGQVYDNAVKMGAVFDPLRLGILNLQENAREFGDTVAASFEDAIINGEDLGDVLESLGQDILKLLIRSQITQPIATGISGWVSGLFGGGKATGGDVEEGSIYRIGEKGTEGFMPGMDGRVVSNEQLRNAFATDGKSNNTQVNIKQDFSLGVTAEARAVVMGMKSTIQRWAMEEVMSKRSEGKLR